MSFREILTKSTKQESFNTTNGWGFGGTIGTTFTFDNGITLTYGTTFYRHLNPSKFCRVRKDGEEVIYASKLSLSGKQLEKLENLLK